MREISSIDFLTPAKVTFDSTEFKNTILVDVDLKKRKVYQKIGNGVFEWEEKDNKAFFAKLDVVMYPPENMYANKFGSDEDVNDIKQRFEKIQEEEAWETK